MGPARGLEPAEGPPPTLPHLGEDQGCSQGRRSQHLSLLLLDLFSICVYIYSTYLCARKSPFTNAVTAPQEQLHRGPGPAARWDQRGLGAEPQGGQPRRPAIPHPCPAFQHFPLVLTQGLLVEAWSPGEAALRPVRRRPPFCPSSSLPLPSQGRCNPLSPSRVCAQCPGAEASAPRCPGAACLGSCIKAQRLLLPCTPPLEPAVETSTSVYYRCD